MNDLESKACAGRADRVAPWSRHTALYFAVLLLFSSAVPVIVETGTIGHFSIEHMPPYWFGATRAAAQGGTLCGYLVRRSSVGRLDPPMMLIMGALLSGGLIASFVDSAAAAPILVCIVFACCMAATWVYVSVCTNLLTTKDSQERLRLARMAGVPMFLGQGIAPFVGAGSARLGVFFIVGLSVALLFSILLGGSTRKHSESSPSYGLSAFSRKAKEVVLIQALISFGMNWILTALISLRLASALNPEVIAIGAALLHFTAAATVLGGSQVLKSAWWPSRKSLGNRGFGWTAASLASAMVFVIALPEGSHIAAAAFLLALGVWVGLGAVHVNSLKAGLENERNLREVQRLSNLAGMLAGTAAAFLLSLVAAVSVDPILWICLGFISLIVFFVGARQWLDSVQVSHG